LHLYDDLQKAVPVLGAAFFIPTLMITLPPIIEEEATSLIDCPASCSRFLPSVPMTDLRNSLILSDNIVVFFGNFS